MPFVLLVLFVLSAIAFIPLLFVLRFRFGSARRRARPWLANFNVVVLAISSLLLLVSASIMNRWVADALRSAGIGFACGALLSVFGLLSTKWEKAPDALFYKPNRWFALIVPLALMLRIFYWIWRSWHAWGACADTRCWLASSGTAGSLGVGAAVAGYYFGYTVGVWQKINALTPRPRFRQSR
jgi:hypothetical protein